MKYLGVLGKVNYLSLPEIRQPKDMQLVGGNKKSSTDAGIYGKKMFAVDKIKVLRAGKVVESANNGNDVNAAEYNQSTLTLNSAATYESQYENTLQNVNGQLSDIVITDKPLKVGNRFIRKSELLDLSTDPNKYINVKNTFGNTELGYAVDIPSVYLTSSESYSDKEFNDILQGKFKQASENINKVTSSRPNNSFTFNNNTILVYETQEDNFKQVTAMTNFLSDISNLDPKERNAAYNSYAAQGGYLDEARVDDKGKYEDGQKYQNIYVKKEEYLKQIGKDNDKIYANYVNSNLDNGFMIVRDFSSGKAFIVYDEKMFSGTDKNEVKKEINNQLVERKVAIRNNDEAVIPYTIQDFLIGRVKDLEYTHFTQKIDYNRNIISNSDENDNPNNNPWQSYNVLSNKESVDQVLIGQPSEYRNASIEINGSTTEIGYKSVNDLNRIQEGIGEILNVKEEYKNKIIDIEYNNKINKIMREYSDIENFAKLSARTYTYYLANNSNKQKTLDMLKSKLNKYISDENNEEGVLMTQSQNLQTIQFGSKTIKQMIGPYNTVNLVIPGLNATTKTLSSPEIISIGKGYTNYRIGNGSDNVVNVTMKLSKDEWNAFMGNNKDLSIRYHKNSPEKKLIKNGKLTDEGKKYFNFKEDEDGYVTINSYITTSDLASANYSYTGQAGNSYTNATTK